MFLFFVLLIHVFVPVVGGKHVPEMEQFGVLPFCA